MLRVLLPRSWARREEQQGLPLPEAVVTNVLDGPHYSSASVLPLWHPMPFVHIVQYQVREHTDSPALECSLHHSVLLTPLEATNL